MTARVAQLSLPPAGRRVLLMAAVLAAAGLAGLATAVSPILAVAALAALLFVLVTLSDLTLGVAAFIVLQFLTLLPLFQGSQLTGVKLAGGLLVVSWIGVLLFDPERASLGLVSASPRLTIGLLVFLGWALLSTAWAIDRAPATDAITRFALNFILLAVVFSAIPRVRELRMIAGAIVVGGSLAAGMGIWLSGGTSDDERLTGTVGDPNALAAVLVPSLVIGLALAGTSRSFGRRCVYLVSAGIAAFGILLSGSRGGLIAVGVALIVWVFVAGRWRGRIALTLLSLSVAGVVYFRSAAPTELRERVTSLGGGTGREDIWKIGWRAFQAEPITGHGVGNFTRATPRYLLVEPGLIRRTNFIIDTPKVAHNTYLHILVELGIVGLFLFLFVVGACLVAMASARRTFLRAGDEQASHLAGAILAATAGLLAAYFFISGQHEREMWLLLALGPAMLAVARRSLRTAETPP